MKRLPRLMAIRALGPPGEFESWAVNLARAGVDCLQLRDHSASDSAVYECCRSVLAELPDTVALLVNRRPDLAAAAGAAGVHLPASGLPTVIVRRAFGDLVIGRSTHSVAEVAEAKRDGADYVVFGPVFATPEKLRFGPPRGLDELAQACALGIPVLAIGGITVDRLGEVARAGARGAAAIRLFEEPNGTESLVEAAEELFGNAEISTHA